MDINAIRNEIKDLKERAYDLIAMTEQAQAELKQVNNRIGELATEYNKISTTPKEEVKE